MDSSAANTSNLQNTAYIPNTNIGESTQPVSQPKAEKTVDMTGGEQQVAATTVEPKETTEAKKDFNIEANQMNASYAKKYIAPWFNKEKLYTFNENGDGYNLTNVLSNTNAIKEAFTGQIRRDTAFQNSFNEAKNLFEIQDTTNYRYMHHPILGNMRVAIDSEGKDIGLPEPINESGSPVILEDPNNIHTLLPS